MEIGSYLTPTCRLGAALALSITVLVGCAASRDAAPSHAAASSMSSRPLAIEAMSPAGPEGNVYLADPNPVHLAPSATPRPLVFSGTTDRILQCAQPVSAGCFAAARVQVDAGSLGKQISAAGATVTNFQNLDVFQDDGGTWHAALTIGVHSLGHPEYWTVVVHAHPRGATWRDTPPLAWSADTVLAGSFAAPFAGNYDAKYLEDDGRLYLLYVTNVAPPPVFRNQIVLQPMTSPTQPAATGPITLLAPGDRHGEFDSERYGDTQARLVEAPYVARIGGKYALFYSTGAYQRADYKAAVAWSDTLLPSHDGRYRKVLEPDRDHVWSTAGRPEVHYLLQSQHPRWPDFTAPQVIGPGVASAVRSPDDAWWLCFAGFDPADRPLIGPGIAEPDHRRPYFVKLHAAVPAGRSVASVGDAELARWLEPETR